MRALVPIKLLTGAKQRLGGVLTPEQRRGLTLAMAADVLSAVAACDGIDSALIISRNDEADELAATFGFERYRESEECNLPGALTEAIHCLAPQDQAAGVLILPADLPLLLPTDLACIVKKHEHLASVGAACTLVADQALVGTNALALTPADGMTLIFDGASYRPHLKEAISRGLLAQTLSLGNLALDIDTPQDLARLRALRPDSHAGRFLASSAPQSS